MSSFDWIAFDADDTLWHTEHLYADAQKRFIQILDHYFNTESVHQKLFETETRNIAHFGFGVKAFALSMIETAVELTEGRVSGQDIQTLIEIAKAMLNTPVELIDGVQDTIDQLATESAYHLMLITKGDLLDQETKIARSGLGQAFEAIEIVSDKTPQIYQRLFAHHAIQGERFLMIGNSLRSDILPVLACGASAIYIPYHTTWMHEIAELPSPGTPGFHQLERISLLPDWLAQNG